MTWPQLRPVSVPGEDRNSALAMSGKPIQPAAAPGLRAGEDRNTGWSGRRRLRRRRLRPVSVPGEDRNDTDRGQAIDDLALRPVSVPGEDRKLPG